jgi:hypothetical protein
MAYTNWETQKRTRCERVGEEVRLEARVVYPAEILPDQPPRILGRRCSRGVECNQLDQPTCYYSGTLPDFDPLSG